MQIDVATARSDRLVMELPGASSLVMQVSWWTRVAEAPEAARDGPNRGTRIRFGVVTASLPDPRPL